MTKEIMAERLNGRTYRDEMDKSYEQMAKKYGLVVVFGASDDLIEFRGAIDDEAGCYNGGDIYITAKGLLNSHAERCECEYCGYEAAKSQARKIEAVWWKDGYSWTYKTDIPHATFDILEDGEKFCRGIVFSMADLKA